MEAVYFLTLFGACLFCESLAAGSKVRQERAELTYFNPVYVTNVKVFTVRARRNDPYLTNMTGIVVVPYNNNVSISFGIQMKTGDDLTISYKVCDAIKMKWATTFLKEYSDIPARCPITPGSYSFFNMELPPKNIPIPLPDGNYHFILSIFLSDNPKEKIIVATVYLRYEQSKRRL